MRPVLLPRHEIDKKKAEERRQQMEEGMRIATSVDVLRETRAKEEALMENYLNETLKGIQEQIQAKHLESEKLDSDIRVKREEWNQLMQPIDKNWMWFVKSEKARIESQVGGNAKREQELTLAIAANIERERMNDQHAKELEVQKKSYHQLAIEMKQELARAKEVVAEAKKNADNLILKAKERDQQSREREITVAEHENYLKLKEEELTRHSNELQEREFKVLAKELQFYSPVKKI